MPLNTPQLTHYTQNQHSPNHTNQKAQKDLHQLPPMALPNFPILTAHIPPLLTKLQRPLPIKKKKKKKTNQHHFNAPTTYEITQLV